jgi:NADH dehydrogenase FAD-containing subunit
VASCNLGSEVPRPWEGRFGEETVVFPVKPIINLMGARRRLLGLAHGGKSRILVAGGGPAAVEVAGNAWRAARQCIEAKGGTEPEITILAGRSLLRGWPQKAVDMARGSLARRGLKVVEDGHVVSAENGKVVLENGVAHHGDLLLVATGTRPPVFFEQAGMQTGPDGGMAVNRYLQSLSHPEMFGGGDCLYHSQGPLARVGVYAVRQNPVLRRNLMAALEGGELSPFNPQRRYMLILNMGDGAGLLRRGGFCCLNRPAFWLKNMIDRRFIAKHQA